MPNWHPNWQDVRWNHDAANRAIAALRRIAEELERTAQERMAAARLASGDFRGPHADTFEAHVAEVHGRAHALAAYYREAAGRIAQASERARAEQLRRVQQRDRWRREWEDERRRGQLLP